MTTYALKKEMSKKEKKKLIFVLFRSIRIRETEVRKERNHQHCIDRSYGSIHTNFTVFARHSFKILKKKKVNIRIFYVLRMPAKKRTASKNMHTVTGVRNR